jgi:hypothetical protein
MHVESPGPKAEAQRPRWAAMELLSKANHHLGRSKTSPSARGSRPERTRGLPSRANPTVLVLTHELSQTAPRSSHPKSPTPRSTSVDAETETRPGVHDERLPSGRAMRMSQAREDWGCHGRERACNVPQTPDSQRPKGHVASPPQVASRRVYSSRDARCATVRVRMPPQPVGQPQGGGRAWTPTVCMQPHTSPATS